MHLVKVVKDVGIVSLDPFISQGTQGSIDSLEEVCRNLLAKNIDLCLFDMTDVSTVPSIFLATIVTLQNRLNATGGRLALLKPARYVRKLLNITVVTELIEVFEDEDEAVESLRRAKNAEYENLVRQMSGADSMSRLAAAKKLARMGDVKGLNYLVDSLDNPDENTRFQATLCLSELGGQKVVAPLVKALKDEFYKVRCYAAEALGTIKAEEALDPLKMIIRFDHNRNVVAKASEAVDKIVHRTRA